MQSKHLREIIPIIFIILTLTLGAAIFTAPCSPEQFPTHWNAAGQIDGWSSRTFTALFFPLLSLSMYLLLLALPSLDPLKKNYSAFDWGYFFTRLWLAAFFFEIYLLTILAGWGFSINPGPYIIISIALFFVGIGMALPTVKRNYFFGIRTPWTLQSEAVWLKTHRLAARVFIIMGFLSALTVFAGKYSLGLFLIIVFGGCLIPVIYSYRAYRQKN